MCFLGRLAVVVMVSTANCLFYSRRLKLGSLSIQGLDHHLGLALFGNQEISAIENSVHGINHAVETAGRSSFLREPHDAKLTPPAMLDNGHDLGSKRHFFDIEVCVVA